ncbi:MAG: hypothetical protein HY216_11415 [Candidatus Rokubacteria bacterium]|nr:hypothetical protein [Candidatus Rokubacteria bacterium]
MGILAVLALLVVAAPAVAVGDERADWGVAVSVGWEQNTLLLRNDEGFQLIVVDTDATIQSAGLGAMTFTDVQPGDRVDYAVSDWAGMAIADTLHVTPNRRAEAR